jgi:hypothetical protein
MGNRKGKYVKQLDLFRESIVDNLAGGGGASIGMEKTKGLKRRE